MNEPYWPCGGGDTGNLVRAFDWSATSLGAISGWPQSLRTAVDIVLNSPVAMVLMWGADHVMVYNDAYSIIAGARHPGALGGTVAALWPEIWDWNRAVLEAGLRGEVLTYGDQHLIVERNGVPEDVWFDLFYTPVREEASQVVGVLCTVIETTGRVLAQQRQKQAEEALLRLNETLEAEREAVKEANRRLSAETGFLRGLFEQAPSFMAVLRGPEHVFELANRPYMQLVGRNDIVGKTIRQALPELAGQGFFELLDSVYRSGESFVGKQVKVLLRMLPDRPMEERLVDFVYQPIRTMDGNVSGIFVEGMDVTERAATEERLRIAQEAGGIGTFEWFPDTGQLAISDAYRLIWGIAPGMEVSADLMLSLVEPEYRHLAAQARLGAMDNPLAYAEFLATRMDTGEKRWIARRGEVIRGDARAPRRYVGVVLDITERKRTEEALRDLNETLEQRVIEEVGERAKAEEALRQAQKMEAVGQLTGGIAHDFNNVLQIIAGNLQLLQIRIGDHPNVSKHLNTAITAVERGARLSSHLLAFARRQPLQPVVKNLGRLVPNMDELLRRALGETIDVETFVDDGLWNTLVDPSQLENVILNMAINARDAMRGEGKLTIELANAMLNEADVLTQPDVRPGQYVLLSISDTGCGMSAEVAQKAFEPFFTTKPQGEGTGLGLSMAYGFVKQSGGHIRIYSEPGRGTTMHIYLPRSLESEADVPNMPARPVVGGQETILVVEDDAGVRATVVDLLTALGYRVLKADSGQSALVILKSGLPVDLLFTDVIMPGPIRSTDLARQAKQLLPDLAVLFTSGYMHDAMMHEGRLDPGVALLGKPYRREELARKIGHMLANKRHAASAQPKRHPAAGNLSEPGTQAALRILVVEDNEAARQLACEMLTALGHAAQGASSAEEALRLLAGGRCDLLFTDLNLPGMGGVELAEKAVRDSPALKVIFASGCGMDATTRAGLAAVSLPKPYDFEQLQAALAAIGHGDSAGNGRQRD